MIRLPLSQLGKWDRGQKDMKKGGGRETWEGSWVRKSRDWERTSEIHKTRRIGERWKKSWGEQEEDRERDDDRKKKNNNGGWRSGWKTTKAASAKEKENKQEREGDGLGCQGGGREQSFHSLFFHFVLAKHQALRSPFRHTFLSCQYVLQKYNSGGWKDWLWPGFRLCLLVEVTKPLHPICHFVSRGSTVRTVSLRGEGGEVWVGGHGLGGDGKWGSTFEQALVIALRHSQY